MKFDRTEEGFARAYETGTSMARTHKRDYILAVYAEDPDVYQLVMASLHSEQMKLAPGTKPMRFTA